MWMRRLASEPFARFTLLGALVFVGHRLMTRTADVPTIEVTRTKQRELVKLFEQRQKRPPNDAERVALVRRYVEDEALFREGMRSSLVSTDPMLRAQMIARMRTTLQAELDQKPPLEADLRTYFDSHASEYSEVATSAPAFETVRERVTMDFRKDRTARAFRSELDRLVSRWRVEIAERP